MFINKLTASLIILLVIGDSFGQDSLHNEKGDSRLVVKSNPSGAKVLLDKENVGVTPLVLSNLQSRQYAVTVELNNSIQEKSVVTLHNEERELFFILDGDYGLLNFYSTPSGAQVFLDDSLYGVTPLQNVKHSTGLAKMVLVKPDYDTVSQIIKISKMKSDFYRNLEYSYGYITISSKSPVLNMVFDGEEFKGDSFVNQRIPKGIHTIGLSAPDFHKTVTSEITVPSKSQSEIVFNYNYLTPKYLIESTLLPGLGQFEDKSPKEGAIYFFGVVIPAVIGIKASNDYKNQLENYNKQKVIYSKALTEDEAIVERKKLEDLLQSANKSIDVKNIGLGIALGVYLVNLIDAAVFHMRDGSIEIYTKPLDKVLDGQANELGIKIKL